MLKYNITEDIIQLKVINGYTSILKRSGDGILHIPLKVSELLSQSSEYSMSKTSLSMSYF
jgi:hypothetical protein